MRATFLALALTCSPAIAEQVTLDIPLEIAFGSRAHNTIGSAENSLPCATASPCETARRQIPIVAPPSFDPVRRVEITGLAVLLIGTTVLLALMSSRRKGV